MNRFTFDLGEDIDVLAARIAQPPEKDLTGNVHMYSYMRLSGEPAVKFARTSLEIEVEKVDGLLLVTDKRMDDGRVSDATLYLKTTNLTSHQLAQTRVNDLVSQFQRGKWKRYIPDTCPWVSGRSTMLNAAGQVDIGACPLDPTLVFTAQEWPNLAAHKLRWQWIGDGRVATLEVQYAYNKPDVPTYTVNLQFELEEAMKFYAAKELQEMKAEFGEGKVAAGAARGAAEIRLLEEAALKRGDQVIPRP